MSKHKDLVDGRLCHTLCMCSANKWGNKRVKMIKVGTPHGPALQNLILLSDNKLASLEATLVRNSADLKGGYH